MKKLTQIITIAIISFALIFTNSFAEDKKPSKRSCCEKSVECKDKKPCQENKSSETNNEKENKEVKIEKSNENKKENKVK